MPPESVILSTSKAFETCQPTEFKMAKCWGRVDGSGSCNLLSCLSFSLSFSFSLTLSPPPVSWPNPEAPRHCSISVTFDGPGLKQICIPLVDFKHCLNNDASQRRVNEACSGLAMTDFKINLIRGRFYLCTSLLLWLLGCVHVCMCVCVHDCAKLFPTFPPFLFFLLSFFHSPHFILFFFRSLFPTLLLSRPTLPLYSLVSEAWLN